MVAVGDNALTGITTGTENTAVGRNAGFATTSGYRNTYLGHGAGDALTTGSNNTILGHGSDASSATVSNEITLGNASVNKFRIPGMDFVIDAGNVGVGTSSPSYPLVVYRNAATTHVRSAVLNPHADAYNATHIYQTTNRQWEVGAFDTAVGLTSTWGVRDDTATAYRLVINSSGNVGIGTSSPSYKLDIQQGGATAAQAVRVADSTPTEYFGIFNANNGGSTPNAANATVKVRGMATTSRSINAGGTVNASGADYAEYMTKADDCGTIAKGAVCGVDANGKLTDVFANAHSFVIKSTDPSYVGGDVWSIDSTDADGNQTTLEGDALETARQKVDRIAFSGQVPCTISGTTRVGDFVIAQEKSDGGIEAVAVSSPTFEQYSVAIGKVWKLSDSNKHLVAVKIS